MTELVLYVILAIAILVLASWLARERSLQQEPESAFEEDSAKCPFDPRCLELANRIFDPADYRWLREELCFPQAASVLARHRKELAVEWLRGLRSSFKELVSLPEPAPAEENPGREVSSWQLLWLTLRFHFLLGYALAVVRLFGPYHQLVPRFGWLRGLGNLGYARTHHDALRAGRIS